MTDPKSVVLPITPLFNKTPEYFTAVWRKYNEI